MWSPELSSVGLGLGRAEAGRGAGPYKAEECAPCEAGPGQRVRPYLASTHREAGGTGRLGCCWWSPPLPPSCDKGLSPRLQTGEVMG